MNTPTDRYIATNRHGHHIIRTNSKREADRYAEQMRGTVIDQEEQA